MLANFFGKSKPVNFIVIFALFLAYILVNMITNTGLQLTVSAILDILAVLPGMLLLFFLFNFILVKNKLTKDNTFAFLLFVIGIGLLDNLVLDYAIIGEYLLLLLFLRKVYTIRTQKAIYQKLFDGGLWIGVLILFSPLYVLFLILLFAAINLFLKITLRVLVIPFLGFIIPILFFFTYHFYHDTITEFYAFLSPDLYIDLSFYNTSFYLSIFIVFGFLVLMSVMILSGKIFSVNNLFKRSWILLIIHAIIALAFSCFVVNKTGVELFVFFIPVSILIANWLQRIKKKLYVNLIVGFLLVFSVVIHFI
ncbi:MAG: hypothetical protein HWD85_11755 [Flavobacteriaceae bacterium]|nr:hypothetical protein [Flavobacteriaceae bacterium]